MPCPWLKGVDCFLRPFRRGGYRSYLCIRALPSLKASAIACSLGSRCLNMFLSIEVISFILDCGSSRPAFLHS